ncbi:MAG: AAA family ATPase [Clostridia bacterium]|nr:AAA family ATPase [Clostridia bacterium]
MTETTGKEAKTIHRLLEIGKIQDEQKLENVDYDIMPIDGDVIIVDEMSMVDVFLMNYLVRGIYLGTKLILVGDSNQLPSVGPGSILKDIIDSGEITVISLNKIFRQAAKSKIIVNAHHVNQGEAFIAKGSMEAKDTEEDFFYVNEPSQEKILNQVISLVSGRLASYGDYEFYRDIQVLTPTKKGMLGTKELNKALQDALNPMTTGKQEKSYGEQTFREKDRVMQIKNDYDIFWERKTTKEVGTGIFNGEIGTITKIDQEEKQIKIEFDDDKVAWYSFSILEEIELAYGITIHKSQGSEFNVVILVIPPSSPMLLTRNLLYTAITRAKKLLIIIGSNRLIEFMIKNADGKTRNTGLEFKLIKTFE